MGHVDCDHEQRYLVETIRRVMRTDELREEENMKESEKVAINKGEECRKRMSCCYV